MNLEEEIELAKRVCVDVHAGQFRRDGVTAYHMHPFAVAAAVPDELKPAAYLHDVLEDTPILLANLIGMGFSKRTIEAVWMLTNYRDNSYDSYIQVLIQSPDAVVIKIADMEHNLSCEPSENSKRKIAKWLPVLKQRFDEQHEHTAGS